jgi:hypothetical protein
MRNWYEREGDYCPVGLVTVGGTVLGPGLGTVAFEPVVLPVLPLLALFLKLAILSSNCPAACTHACMDSLEGQRTRMCLSPLLKLKRAPSFSPSFSDQS